MGQKDFIQKLEAVELAAISVRTQLEHFRDQTAARLEELKVQEQFSIRAGGSVPDPVILEKIAQDFAALKQGLARTFGFDGSQIDGSQIDGSAAQDNRMQDDTDRGNGERGE
ncbi:gp93 [Mycobacterium phage Konstantine]|uniref:Uncharacterized protein n=1 Tax=Mycobacterium phage Konstantine TaxID=563121 RepID=B5U4W8_9CAUD|nr:gp93 [Mycobacterium phage Konstantine]ACI12508.1 hypothetical protein KONSTANTINE_93 [Mycobacterium phage Konstantine]